MNRVIFAVVMDIILNIVGNFLSTAQKHNRYDFKHNRPGLNESHGCEIYPSGSEKALRPSKHVWAYGWHLLDS